MAKILPSADVWVLKLARIMMGADVDDNITFEFKERKFIFQPCSDDLYYFDTVATNEPVTNYSFLSTIVENKKTFLSE